MAKRSNCTFLLNVGRELLVIDDKNVAEHVRRAQKAESDSFTFPPANHCSSSYPPQRSVTTTRQVYIFPNCTRHRVPCVGRFERARARAAISVRVPLQLLTVIVLFFRYFRFAALGNKIIRLSEQNNDPGAVIFVRFSKRKIIYSRVVNARIKTYIYLYTRT